MPRKYPSKSNDYKIVLDLFRYLHTTSKHLNNLTPEGQKIFNQFQASALKDRAEFIKSLAIGTLHSTIRGRKKALDADLMKKLTQDKYIDKLLDNFETWFESLLGVEATDEEVIEFSSAFLEELEKCQKTGKIERPKTLMKRLSTENDEIEPLSNEVYPEDDTPASAIEFESLINPSAFTDEVYMPVLPAYSQLTKESNPYVSSDPSVTAKNETLQLK